VCGVRLDLTKASYFDRVSGERIESRERALPTPAARLEASPDLGLTEVH
jgi:hypothetical protein